ncbi:MAG: HAD-IB family phosphatase [Patescibacteria group bacterium]|jgi:HAD superfamily phosphoserine phosphatase-like hydrolase
MIEKIGQLENKSKLYSLEHKFYPTIMVDIDSCLVGYRRGYGIEGIDILALMQGQKVEKAVIEITNNAMGGDKPFDEALSERLNIIKPKEKQLAKVEKIYLDNIVPNALKTFNILKNMGVDISLLSGGFINMMEKLAEHLGILLDQVYANELLFDKNGDFVDFDRENLLSKEGGKKLQIEKLLEEKKIASPIAIVGDGTSEVKTAPTTDLRIGFGGFAQRKKVEEKADVFLTDPTFAPLILLLLDPTQIRQIIYEQPENKEILQKAFDSIRNARFNNRAKNLKRSIDELYNEFAHFNY